MIRIKRTASPAVLKKKRTPSTAYRNRKVVEELLKMQFDKCCYSEMKIPATGQGKAVEHFRPQSIFAGLRTQWDNLLLACSHCNGLKSNNFPVMVTDDPTETKVIYARRRTKSRPAIINPADPNEFPERDLTYVLDVKNPWFGQIKPRHGSVRGRQTIEATGIGDDFFRKLRRGRLMNVLLQAYRDLMQSEEDNDEDQLRAVKQRYEGYMRPQAAFAGLAREFARVFKLGKRFHLQIPKRDA